MNYQATYRPYNGLDAGGGRGRGMLENEGGVSGGGVRGYLGGAGVSGRGIAKKPSKRVISEADPSRFCYSEVEITGVVCNVSPVLWSWTFLTRLSLYNNSLTRLSPAVARLQRLHYLDLSSNKLRDLPPELGDIPSLSVLQANNNLLTELPWELGRLFKLQTIGLRGNPLPPDILVMCGELSGAQNLITFLQDHMPGQDTPLPQARRWIPLAQPDRSRSTAQFSVLCYNVLCDNYCTRALYAYCPAWARAWEYRKLRILDEMTVYEADIISLQEVEADQFRTFFEPELASRGYSGCFSVKSRARTMTEAERKHVDGCAIFYRTAKFRSLGQHLIEFNQVAIETADGQRDMINRVMTKDNVGLAVMLETSDAVWAKDLQSDAYGSPAPPNKRQPLLVATCHVHWDPEYCDVKLIQTMLLMSRLQAIIRDFEQGAGGATTATPRKANPGGGQADNGGEPGGGNIPLILCGDLNSLPDSGVVEYLTTGRVTTNHRDFKEINYEDCLHKLSPVSDVRDMYSHAFHLSGAYSADHMPYTNYTYDFKGVIDYMFYSRERIRTLGVLGGPTDDWFHDNRIVGCPHPQIPSDHLPLVAHFELTPAPTSPAAPTNHRAASQTAPSTNRR